MLHEVKSKIMGHYRISLLQHNGDREKGALRIWLTTANRLAHDSGMKSMAYCQRAYANMNTLGKIESLLGNKIRVTQQAWTFRW